jgi:replicative DNA helicase
MRDEDFDSVTAIAAERADIEINMSSTPTGKRGRFYDACTNPSMGFTEHYHPSSHNPNWGPDMEAEFRAQLSEQGYIHEIEADFGIQEAGVFNKSMLDMAMQKEFYAYTELDHLQRGRMNRESLMPKMHLYSRENPAPYNPFRTMGIDLDKFSAGSSLLVLEYDITIQQFRVLKRYEVSRGEYSYDNAFNKILEFNEIYRPSWIYMDRGNTGEYMLERLHLHGKEHPDTMMHNKVKGYQFKNTLEIEDPITREVTKQPMKPFMVTQLEIAISRDKLILSPFDDHLHKQLIDYSVEKVTANGTPVYTSVNEHFVDALGLAYLAFALEFPDIVNVIKRAAQQPAKMVATPVKLGERRYNNLWSGMQTMFTPVQQEYEKIKNSDDSPDRQKWIKVDSGYNFRPKTNGWGSRSGGAGSGAARGGRSIW